MIFRQSGTERVVEGEMIRLIPPTIDWGFDGPRGASVAN